MSEPEEGEKRPRYCTQPVSVLRCAAGNLEHADGRPVVVVTIGRVSGRIEPLAVGMDDCRRMVSELLVALATNNDRFAQNLLDDSFPSDADDKYFYPKPEEF